MVMLYKIILTPSLNGNDYLKSLAALNVKPSFTFGVRYFNSLELAQYLMQYSGIVCPKEFATDLSISAEMYQRVKQIEYFKKYSFTDVYELVKSVKELRKCIASNEVEEIKKLLTVKTFKEKNEAIIEFYKQLMMMMEENNIIDEIGLIRYAISYSSPIKDIEFIRYEEFEYTPLDIALINASAGKEVTPIKLFDNQKEVISSYTKAFGQNSEIEDVLAYIYKNNIPFDECLIATSDTNTYGKILSNYQAVLNFPLIVNSGQSIDETSCGRLFGSIIDWMENHNHLDFLVALFDSREFNLDLFKEDIGYIQEDIDKINYDLALNKYDVLSFESIVKVVGDLKLGVNDIDKNNQRLSRYETLINDRVSYNPNDNTALRDQHALTFVKRINEMFKYGIPNILKRYVVIDETNASIENNALKHYLDAFRLMKNNHIPFEEMVKFLNHVEVGNRKPAPGSLFLTSITNAIPFIRKHLFVVGLDSKTFPGKVKEDPTILDQDYELFGIEEASSRNIRKNKELYHDLIGVATSLNVDIHLSYAYYNSETAKEQNASSVFFETYKNENGENKTVNDLNKEFENKDQNKFRSVGFFENEFFPLSVMGKKAKEVVLIKSNDVKESDTKDVLSLSMVSSRGLSATAIEKYVECPYEFFLNVLLHIDQERDTNIYEIISNIDVGNLAHELMEGFNTNITKDQFLKKAETKFNEYLIAHPSDNPKSEEKARDDFLMMMSNGYDMEVNENLPSVLKEENIYTTHKPTGLKIHGFPDKIVKICDGHYRIVDYKTGNKVKHNVNDAETMLQGALYAYIIENGTVRLNGFGKEKIKVDEVVFRYLKSKVNVSTFDRGHDIQEYLDKLDEVLLQIAESLKTGIFEKSGDCKNCYFRSVCGGRK